MEVSVCEKRVWECLCKQREWGGGGIHVCQTQKYYEGRRRRGTGGKGGRVFADRGGYSYIPLQNMRLLKIYN